MVGYGYSLTHLVFAPALDQSSQKELDDTRPRKLYIRPMRGRSKVFIDGKKVRAMRRAKGLTISELGVSQHTVIDIENGLCAEPSKGRGCNANTARAIAKNLGCLVEHILVPGDGQSFTQLDQRTTEIAFIEEVEKRELDANVVWLLLSDFYWSLDDPYADRVVGPNLKRGAIYHYMFPESLKSEAQRLLPRHKLSTTGSNVLFTAVPDEIFDLAPYEIIIFDPDEDRVAGYSIDLQRRFSATTFDVRLSREELRQYKRKFLELQRRYGFKPANKR